MKVIIIIKNHTINKKALRREFMKIIKKKLFTIIVLNLAIVIGFVSTFILTKDNQIEISETNVAQISNKKIAWGIKRNSEHQQPDVGSVNQKILEDNKGICLGSKDQKVIYLKFDNVYDAGYKNQILDTLKENEVTATFFITAHYLNTAQELVQRMIEEGHMVGNQFPIMVMYHI